MALREVPLVDPPYPINRELARNWRAGVMHKTALMAMELILRPTNMMQHQPCDVDCCCSLALLPSAAACGPPFLNHLDRHPDVSEAIIVILDSSCLMCNSLNLMCTGAIATSLVLLPAKHISCVCAQESSRVPNRHPGFPHPCSEVLNAQCSQAHVPLKLVQQIHTHTSCVVYPA